MAGLMLAAPAGALAQSTPSVHSDDPFSLMRGTQQPGEKRPVKLEARLADPALFAQDPQAFNAAADRLAAARSDKDKRELRWLEAAEKAEALAAELGYPP